MSKVKEKVPNLEKLRAELSRVMSSNLPDFLNSTHSRREEVRGNRRFLILSTIFLVAVVMELYIAFFVFERWYTNIIILFTILWVVIMLVTGKRWLTNTKLLAQEMNMALVPILSNILDRTILYTSSTEDRDAVSGLLKESALVTLPKIQVISDDRYSVFADREIIVRELVVDQVKKDKNDKEYTDRYFKGVLVAATLEKSRRGKTYLSTDGDRSGYAHKTFWGQLTGTDLVKETELEWNDFEDHLHVATTDPTEAREILTPDFMADVYDWWVQHKLNMRIAFIDNKFYMLLPDSSIKFEKSTTSTKPESIERYAWTILRPIWRTITLVEDIG